MKKLKIENIDISAIKPHPQNPRKHPKNQIAQIAQSIEIFGFNNPVLIDESNRLICGHGRIQACKKLGWKEVPAIRAKDLGDEKTRAYMIADNRLTENSVWDEDLLGENFKTLSELDLDFDIEVIGFDYGDIEKFINLNEDEEPSKEETVITPDEAPQIAKEGDLWALGNHRIYCGDSLKKESYESLFSGTSKQASIVFTDPPYNLSARDISQTCAEHHGDFAMGSGEMSSQEFTSFLQQIFENLVSHTADGSIHYICMDWRHAPELLEAGSQVYEELKNTCVWVKSTGGMGTFYRSQHELIFVYKNGKAKHQNHFKLGQHGRYRSNVWNYPSVMHLDAKDGDKAGKEALQLHPTIKPVAMIEDALKDCSRRKEIVLDAFLGSGSTLIAAEKAQRICYGIELSPRYVDVAIQRWQEWTGKTALNLNDTKSTHKD